MSFPCLKPEFRQFSGIAGIPVDEAFRTVRRDRQLVRPPAVVAARVEVDRVRGFLAPRRHHCGGARRLFQSRRLQRVRPGERLRAALR